MSRFPQPRVGQIVTLRNGGREAEVIVVLRGVDALRAKTEVEILVLASRMQSSMGRDWTSEYYEATVQILKTEKLETVSTKDVLSVRDQG